MILLVALLLAALATLSFAFLLVPRILSICGAALGNELRQRAAQRKELLLARCASDKRRHEQLSGSGDDSAAPLDDGWEKVETSRSLSDAEPSLQEQDRAPQEWKGVIGFFHPFCNAGGGGERVLWAAIRATQLKWPNALCVVYTGDHDATKDEMLSQVKERFNIQLYPPTVIFLYLSTRHLVLSSTWPHFTLLGQSIGSLIVGYDAFTLLPPDIFIDTMGYAFTLALSKFLFPDVPVGAYVHYPTISTDMLGSLDADKSSGEGINAGAGAGWKGQIKRQYWRLFAKLYGWVGGSADVVMANSSWTGAHIRTIWGPSRTRRKLKYAIEVVFPPTAVAELEESIDVSAESEAKREPVVLYIAQFRPEKNHQLILRAFAKLLQSSTFSAEATGAKPKSPTLLLIGSVRNDTDETYIYSLRLLAHELHITDRVTFVLNAPWPTVLSRLQTASVGVNGMWNEHFGIGVVEYQAAGLISVVHNSGGPKLDIVVDQGGGPTGFHAATEEEFAQGFERALALGPRDALATRLRARKSAKRFSQEAFDGRWLGQMERLVELQMRK